MNIFLYSIIFIIGILFGSFYTLAIYRIPKKEDIIHTHSYCPNCNAKLGFFELIPILSYIFLGGKCKHCGKKIRIRYLLLEILSGFTFVAIALGLKLDAYTININSAISFAFSYLYITCIFIIAGIDLESRKIQKSVLYYGAIISTLYIIYLYILNKTDIYRYVIYGFTMIMFLCLDSTASRKHSESSYTICIIVLTILMAIFTGEVVTIFTIATALLATAFYMIIREIKLAKTNVKKPDNIRQEIRLGFILCFANVVTLITMLNI